MSVLLTISMGLGTAFMYYLTRVLMFSATAALGIFIGIKLRKKKNNKDK